jgi:hypothetical protein
MLMLNMCIFNFLQCLLSFLLFSCACGFAMKTSVNNSYNIFIGIVKFSYSLKKIFMFIILSVLYPRAKGIFSLLQVYVCIFLECFTEK